jgi:hypothetical protein
LRALHVIGMQGLGDNIFQRPFIKALARAHEIYLETSWPELYADLPIKVVNPQTRLRTQLKNVRRSAVRWSPRPAGMVQRKISYVRAFQCGQSIIAGMEQSFGIALPVADFGLPQLPASPVIADKPIAFVRPVTVRREWYNAARNPQPQYIAQIVEQLRPTHHIAIVADLADGAEWLHGPLLTGDSNFIRGELPAVDMLALLAASDIVIGGVGFIVPASIATRRKCFVILGGQGGHNAPDRITDRRLDCSRIGFATPGKFCQCTNMRHNCDKTIADLADQWRNYWQAQDQSSMAPLPGTISASVGIPSALESSLTIAPISNAILARPTAISAAP